MRVMQNLVKIGVLVIIGLALVSTKMLNRKIMEIQTIEQTTALPADQELIKSLIDALFKAADDRAWGKAENTMADPVYVDYSALGGAVGFQSPKEIVSAWKAFLPGFDRTVHQVHNQAIWVAGDRASATFDAIATHYLNTGVGEYHWTVFVGYDTEFIRRDGNWRLARIDLSLYDQVGNTALPQAAFAVIAEGSAKPLATDSEATPTVERFFRALESTDFDGLVNTLSEEVIQKMPLAPASFPKIIEGSEAMKALYKGVLVAPWLHNPAIARSIYDLRPGGTEGLLASAKVAREKYESTGEMAYVLGASELDPLSAMYVPENAFDYYLDPAKAAGAKYDNRFAVSSWEPWLTFDGIVAGKDIAQPVFIVHSESGAVPQGTKEFYGHLQGYKKIVWLNEFNQQQLYFQAEDLNAAIGEVVKYLKKSKS